MVLFQTIRRDAPCCIIVLLRIMQFVLCTFLSIGLDMSAGAEPAASVPTSQQPLAIQGYVSGKYVFRQSKQGDAAVRDEDVFGELRLDISQPSTDKYEFHFFGTVRDDLSGNSDKRAYSAFEDIGNTYSSSVHGYAYEAHLDLNRLSPAIRQIRIGRQDGMREEPVFFDGIAIDASLGNKINATAYGGAAIHFFELDSKWGEDKLGGLGVDYRPLPGSLIAFDFLYLDDHMNQFDSGNRHDHLVSLKLSQRFGPNVRATAKGRLVNDKPRDGKIRLIGDFPSVELEVQGAYFRQFRTEQALATELSKYYDVVGQTVPYQTLEGKLRKYLGARAALDLGYFERTLVDPAQATMFNRTYRRSYAVLDVSDVVIRGFSLSFTGEQWKSVERSFNSAGFDAGYAFKRQRRNARVNVGYYASLYKYDDFQSLGERTNVRTNYIRFEYPLGERYTANGSYESERGLQDYQTAKVGIRYEF